MPTETEASFKPARYYQKLIREIDVPFLSDGENARRAVQVFDHEAANIIHSQKWVADNFENDYDIAWTCHEYGVCAVLVREFRFSASEQIKWLRAGLRASRR